MPKIPDGFILLSRTLLESKLWSYSDATLRVAIYLLLIVNHKPRYFKGVEVKRGQTCKSLTRIADECSLSIKSVRYAIELFVKDGMITKDCPFGAQQGQMITICKYDTYQDVDNYKGTLGAHEGAHALPHNKERSKKERSNIPPAIEEVKSYCQERKNNVDVSKWFNFYQGKGWMVGKNKMKDWQACVRTWEDNDKPKVRTQSQLFDQVIG